MLHPARRVHRLRRVRAGLPVDAIFAEDEVPASGNRSRRSREWFTQTGLGSPGARSTSARGRTMRPTVAGWEVSDASSSASESCDEAVSIT